MVAAIVPSDDAAEGLVRGALDIVQHLTLTPSLRLYDPNGRHPISEDGPLQK
ncbi:hypothetical protein MNEG_15638, partial [Monoraphidium neglectum]